MKDLALSGEKARVLQWAKASPTMEKVRREEIRNANTAQALKNFTGSVLRELERRPALSTSGLVEQQRWFRKLR